VTVAGRRVLLDDISRAIIEQLQQDGRRPYARNSPAGQRSSASYGATQGGRSITWNGA